MKRFFRLSSALVGISLFPLVGFAQELDVVTQALPLLNGEKYIVTTNLHKISGIVRDSNGNPAPGIDVAIQQSHASMHGTGIGASAKTDSSGEYSLEVRMTLYPKTDLYIPMGNNCFWVSVVDQTTASKFVIKWQLDPETVSDNIDVNIPQMTYARIKVESDAPNTVLGNVDVYVTSDCEELNRERKSGEPAKKFYAIAKSDVHGIAHVPVPLGMISLGYNAVAAFEGCNQHVSQWRVPERVQLKPELDSRPFLIQPPFNTMYQSTEIDGVIPVPLIQFDAKEGEVCEVELKIPESGVGKSPFDY